MADRGPHSGECATATGGDCHCDCHGAQHGIKHTHSRNGKHLPDVQITPVKGAGGKVTHYRVTEPDGLPPGGGTKTERLAARAGKVKVTATSKRTPTLPPPVAAWAAKVRESLPKDRAGWDATIPRSQSPREHMLARVADWEGRLAEAEQRKHEIVDRMTASMKESGLTPAKIRKELASGRYLDLNGADENIKYAQEQVDYYRPAAENASTGYSRLYPLDKAGKWKMPPAELEKHLDRVLDVGRQALDAIKAEWERDDELTTLRARIAERQRVQARSNAMWANIDPDNPGAYLSIERKAQLRNEINKQRPEGRLVDDEIALRKREREILRDVIAAHRNMGGVQHEATGLNAGEAGKLQGGGGGGGFKTLAARDDWEKRFRAAEEHFPTEWLRHSAEKPIEIISSPRAFHRPAADKSILAMPAEAYHYKGGYADSIDEVTVHELGHRMEMQVPGLTHLEFAYVRRRSTKPDGKLENTRKLKNIYKGSGYDDHEVAFEDKWSNAYAGKTYESRGDPAAQSWEVFQVGTQDLYGRQGEFDEGDELQAFTLGALLTLA